MSKKQTGFIKINAIFSSDISKNGEIKTIDVSVSGYDISLKKEQELCISKIPINNCSLKKTILFQDIPVGVDRIITIRAFDSDRNELPNFLLRAVTNIVKGDNETLTVDNSTTSFGNVLYGIRNTYDFSEIEKDGRMAEIKRVIEPNIHPCLYNSSKLISELQGFSIPYNATKEDYILKTGSVTFDFLIKDNFEVFVSDPLSKKIENQNAAKRIVVNDIAPGNWILTLRRHDGLLLRKEEIQIKSGENKSLGHLLPDGIAIISDFEPFASPCSWEIEYPKDLKERLTYSGKVFLENKEYHVIGFQKAIGLKCLTTDFSVSNVHGVYIIQNKKISVIVERKIETDSFSFNGLNVTIKNFKKCFIDDPKEKRFILLFSEDLYGKTPYSVKADFNRGINDLYGSYNGNHYTLTRVSDKKLGFGAFWYCYVPYDEIQQTNQSGEPSYNFKINDSLCYATKTPYTKKNYDSSLKFIPKGYIYQKFEGENKLLNFLVLIYSKQNEKEITKKLRESNKSKSLKDFDLSTQEGKQQISNFRLVPGTNTLYRSFHPYRDDKKEISDTSIARMKTLTSLAENVGIKCDINLSDTSLSTITYDMPEYYQSIIDNDKVLYMTICSYDICYSESNSKEFALGIKNILEFIKNNKGPYLTHCAIGTDRTGITCAVLSALCGANWNEIEEDYCASTNMGIFEYRGPGCVRYSMQNFLGISDIETVTNLSESVKDKLKERTTLQDSDIQKAIDNLKAK